MEWCKDHSITLVHIQPGKPVQNGHVESFNGRFRDECLNPNWFVNLADARRKIEAWRKEYNGQRPHSSLAYRTPDEFAKICSELTSGMQLANPTGPPVGFGGSHGSARQQGFAGAVPRWARPLRAPRRRAEECDRDGRLRRDG